MQSRRTLVVEEIENGLFPSQRLASWICCVRKRTRRMCDFIATTHSPALLDALQPEDHEGVVICDRTRKGGAGYAGWSTIRVRRPRWGRALGRAVTDGQLVLTPGPGARLARRHPCLVRRLELLDTTVVVELLDIPYKATQHAAIIGDLASRAAGGIELRIPIAALVESGDHVRG